MGKRKCVKKVDKCGLDMQNYKWMLNENKRGIIEGLLWAGNNIIINLPAVQNPNTRILRFSDGINSEDPDDHPRLDMVMERAVQDLPTLNQKMKYIFSKHNKIRSFKYNRQPFIYTSFDIDNPDAYPIIPPDVDGILNVTYENYDPLDPTAADCTLGKENSVEKIVVNAQFIFRITENVEHVDITIDRGVYGRYDLEEIITEHLNMNNPLMNNIYSFFITKPLPSPPFGLPGIYVFEFRANDKLTGIVPVIQPIISIIGGANIFTTALPTPFVNGVFIEGVLLQPIHLAKMRVLEFSPSTIIHEFGHFFGRVHTHQIIDPKNPFISSIWDVDRIVSDRVRMGNDEEASIDFVRFNFVKQVVIRVGSQGFDPDSIMTYKIERNYSSANEAMKDNYFLSDMDILDLQEAYPGPMFPGGYIRPKSNTISYNNYYNIYIFFGTLLILFFIWRLLHQ
jgi:hypothetical protein